MDDAEADFVIDAVLFLASYGHLFLALYDFDLSSGTWTHKHVSTPLQSFSLDAALTTDDDSQAAPSIAQRKELYNDYLAEARRWAEKLSSDAFTASETLPGELGDLQFFSLPSGAMLQH
jgi:hypothetical protein